ncbi:mitogen-activated protein kinase kinase STE7 [Lachancea thermotolerans CBS 6340]|uniref:mitogen-activated protein kinase kinase n=1 Tax=Lachancea thermotolerans (strain ATCC 56472 / CBS 6340 / NRRL Y-8284) TaxID=559295 RepID=C5E224_LACTC|nr:KLTH0H01584p [Lachancea thermotolerans CBS 6340]CAR30085.1 KLTH0H01584p [Lachancea thermotolerans CBS 6340]
MSFASQDVSLRQKSRPGESGLFQPSSLKRKNLKKLTLGGAVGTGRGLRTDNMVPVSITGSSGSNGIEAPLGLNGIPNGDLRGYGSSGVSPTSDPSSAGITPTEEVPGLTSDLENLSLFQDTTIELQDLVQLGKIGSGNSGTVLKTLHVPDSRIIAKKSIPVENKQLVKSQLMRELSIMRNVKPHDNIVGFFGAFYTASTSNEIVILMEYMDCGSLDKIMSTYKAFVARGIQSPTENWFSEPVLSKISFAVLNGLLYLYRGYKIIHRDIKPSNVLINSKGCVKICDFGVSKKLINSIADTFVGTSTYMSPERIQGSVYSTKGDVWSLGLMIIELVTGEFPLGGHSDTPEGILDLLQRIVNEPPPRLPPQLPNGLQYSREMFDFVNRCCVKDERERSSLQELLCHDFIEKSRSQGDREFRHWCKRIKKWLKEDKMLRREEQERAKLVKRQLESAANAATAARHR